MSASRSQPIFVVFEGLDGAGKTTCARHAAAFLDAELLTTPCPQIREYRDKILGTFGTCQEAAQLFYLSTVFAASEKVKALLAQGRSVVMDRYFLSTQAYAEFRGSKLVLDGLQTHLRPADLTVYLDTPLAHRQQRLRTRSCTSADSETLSDAADARLRALHAEKARLSVSGRWLSIDNSTALPPDVTGLIVRALDELACARAEGTIQPFRPLQKFAASF